MLALALESLNRGESSDEMENINQHIDDFLKYYCELQSPQYAVMLKGKWGSGKTFYINI